MNEAIPLGGSARGIHQDRACKGRNCKPDRDGVQRVGMAFSNGAIWLFKRGDAGIGLDAAALRPSASSGLGTQFIDAFVKQLDGALGRAGGVGGTTLTVRLPLSVLA